MPCQRTPNSARCAERLRDVWLVGHFETKSQILGRWGQASVLFLFAFLFCFVPIPTFKTHLSGVIQEYFVYGVKSIKLIAIRNGTDDKPPLSLVNDNVPYVGLRRDVRDYSAGQPTLLSEDRIWWEHYTVRKPIFGALMKGERLLRAFPNDLLDPISNIVAKHTHNRGIEEFGRCMSSIFIFNGNTRALSRAQRPYYLHRVRINICALCDFQRVGGDSSACFRSIYGFFGGGNRLAQTIRLSSADIDQSCCEKHQQSIEPSLQSIQSILSCAIFALRSVVASLFMQEWGWRSYDVGFRKSGLTLVCGGLLVCIFGLVTFAWGWP
jgi:hypothetical protein